MAAPGAAPRRAGAAAAARDAGALADGLLGVSEIFGTDLPANAAFRQAVVGHLGSLFAVGALATVAKLA